MKTSLFDIFKIGIGPSSSHTVGPMRAAVEFVSNLADFRLLLQTTRVRIELYGSLALTGKGHGTDRALILGLCGESPDTVKVATMESKLANIREMRALPLRGLHIVEFHESRDLVFHKDQTLSDHPNGMRFSAFDCAGTLLHQTSYYSIGGGFIEREGGSQQPSRIRPVPYFFGSAHELLRMSERHRLPIWKIVLENEKSWHTEGEIRAYIDMVWTTMRECVNRGLRADGMLPGGRCAAELQRLPRNC